MLTIGLCEELKNSESSGTYLLVSCARCHQLARTCNDCYRGRRYCASCSELAREDSKRRARLRYQKSSKGREQHRLAQQRYRERKAARHNLGLTPTIEPDVQLELHSPALSVVVECDGSLGLLSTMQEADRTNIYRPQQWTLTSRQHMLACDSCGASCGLFALQPARRRHRKTRHRPAVAEGSRKRLFKP